MGLYIVCSVTSSICFHKLFIHDRVEMKRSILLHRFFEKHRPWELELCWINQRAKIDLIPILSELKVLGGTQILIK